MRDIFDIARKNPLFDGISFDDFNSIYKCLRCEVKSYEKGMTIFHIDDLTQIVGIVLKGSVQISKNDINGFTTIVKKIEEGEMFGEVFACIEGARVNVNVSASSISTILFINIKNLFSSCTKNCSFHGKLIKNMVTLIAAKNLLLNQKLDILSKRTTREKLFAFFSIYSKGKNEFTIPYNRQELADYLCVDRSALSNELSKLQVEGLLSYNKNRFIIL